MSIKWMVSKCQSRDGPDGEYFPVWNSEGLPPTLLEPVESVTWHSCHALLGSLGLQLPSEAQWEYAARAGTDTPWWTGREESSLLGAVNLADAYARANGAPEWVGIADWLNDGYTSHAPVDKLRPNPFGLHQILGNVWEWCLDGFEPIFYQASPELDPVSPHATASSRVLRGGGYVSSASSLARSAYRNFDPPSSSNTGLGVRPSRAVDH